LDEKVSVSLTAQNRGGSQVYMAEGEQYTVEEILKAIVISSGNDAAVVIAENISGMENRFVELMNAKAAELGMSSTHFVDSSGLSAHEINPADGTVSGHYTTVRDYLVLTQYCMRNPTFREIVATSSHSILVVSTTMILYTTDLLPAYLTGVEAIGVKTGYTEEAGYCFVGAGQVGGLELYTVVFCAPTHEQRFIDTAELLEWGFRHYRTIELINTTQQVADVALLSWQDKTVATYVPIRFAQNCLTSTAPSRRTSTSKT
jgi:D-alanyl-D-alanine carboxypeptidase (penicillin-binding protein 5/6)